MLPATAMWNKAGNTTKFLIEECISLPSEAKIENRVSIIA